MDEEKRFMQAIAQQKSSRDKAIALILFSTGLRIGECARLNIENIGAGASSLLLDAGKQIFFR